MKLTRLDKKRVLTVLLVFALFVLTATAGATISKYTSQKNSTGELSNLASFHLTSDLADVEEAGASCAWHNDIYENGVRIRLYNYEKDNVSLVSDVDITYSVDVTPVSGGDTYSVTVLNSDGEAVTSSGDGKYTLPAIVADGVVSLNYQDIIIQCNADTPSSDFKVTVNSSAPYVKTLAVTFAVTSHTKTLDYRVDGGDWHNVLVIHSNGYSGNIEIRWNANLAPDNTNPLMANWTGTTSAILAVEAFSTYELVFVENIHGDYAVTVTPFDASTGITLPTG